MTIPTSSHFVRVNLEIEGFEVETAHGGQSGIDTLLATTPDLVLLDVMMPGMYGITALRQLRSHPSAANTSVILLTAKALPEDRVRGLDLGADDYITKPFDVSELMARVKAVLRRTQAMRDVSPLTGLPGNYQIASELERQIKTGDPFALVQADLDNFKSFNDHYGFMRGDQVITFSARTMLEGPRGDCRRGRVCWPYRWRRLRRRDASRRGRVVLQSRDPHIRRWGARFLRHRRRAARIYRGD